MFFRAAAGGADQVGAEIVRQVPAGADQRPDIEVSLDVAQAYAPAADKVEAQAGVWVGPGEPTITPIVDELHARLVTQLVRPALGMRHVNDVVKAVLNLAPKRGGADHAEVELDDLKLRGFLPLERHRAVKPRGIRPVMRIGNGNVDFRRRVDILAERIGELELRRQRAVTIGIECGEMVAQAVEGATKRVELR